MGMIGKVGVQSSAKVVCVGSFNHHSNCAAKLRGHYHVECLDNDGNLKWVEDCENLITTAGATDLLLQYLKGAAYTAIWYVGIYKGTGTLATSDTMASHAGWTDSTDYSNATRPTLILGTPAAGSVDNSTSVAIFNMNSPATILGAYVVNNNVKGGTAGTLYGIAAFASPRPVLSLDTINCTCTITAS